MTPTRKLIKVKLPLEAINKARAREKSIRHGHPSTLHSWWAQILGSVRTRREGVEEDVPYWTTGVFARDEHGWHWRYWGGAEPQTVPRV
jgi:hypothetical protein